MSSHREYLLICCLLFVSIFGVCRESKALQKNKVSLSDIHGSFCEPSKKRVLYKLGDVSSQLSLRGAEIYEENAINMISESGTDKQDTLKVIIKPEYILNGGNRTELTLSDYFSGDYIFTYEFDLLLPEKFISETAWQIFVQWHDQPNFSNGETWDEHPGYPPVVAMEYKNEKVHVVHRPKPGQAIRSKKIPIQLGTWQSFSFTIRWSPEVDGFISASMNGDNFITLDNKTKFTGPNMYNEMGNYFKFGIYQGPGAKHTNIVYFKDLEISVTCF